MKMTMNIPRTGAYVTLLASVLMPLYWISFALALPMREKYVNWVASKNWIWVNSLGFAAAIVGIGATVFIAVYLQPSLANYVSVAFVVVGSVMMTSLLYFEAYILPGMVTSAPNLVDQSSGLYTFSSFSVIRILGSLIFSVGFVAWGIVWISSGSMSLWSSLCIVLGAPLFALVFIPGNIRLVGVLLYSAGLFGVALRMLR